MLRTVTVRARTLTSKRRASLVPLPFLNPALAPTAPAGDRVSVLPVCHAPARASTILLLSLPSSDALAPSTSTEAMPPGASQVLKESVKSVEAAKEELKAAAKLKAMAAADDKRVESLQGREAELENYQSEKEKFADAAQEIARKADEEYQAEEDQVLEMDGVARTEGTETTTGVATKGSAGKAGGEGAEALRQRLQRHLPLLRVVDKLAQRVGTLKSRGRHPRSEHQLPRRPQVP